MDNKLIQPFRNLRFIILERNHNELSCLNHFSTRIDTLIIKDEVHIDLKYFNKVRYVIVVMFHSIAKRTCIHQSARSFDKGKSASQKCHNALTKDSYVPDAYANTSYAEDFGQVVIVWIYLVDKGRHRNLSGDQFACMKNQLELMTQYLPASSINTF